MSGQGRAANPGCLWLDKRHLVHMKGSCKLTFQERKLGGEGVCVLFSQLRGLVLVDDALRTHFGFDKQSLCNGGPSALGDS